jgi:hypothetical protein
MLIGITLELEDGQRARIRFAETEEGGAHVVCEASKGCVHDLSNEHLALIFQAIGVPLASTPLDSVRAIVAAGKAEELVQAIHTSPAFLDNPQFLILPVPWDDQALAELLELYLAGFTLEMLSRHFEVSVKSIVRKLAEVVWGEENLTQDRTKARYQQTWHKDEIDFLLSQLQLCRTPTEIAALMERDSFGIAFKAFQSLPVPIPKDVQERLGINPRTEPLGSVPLDGKPF